MHTAPLWREFDDMVLGCAGMAGWKLSGMAHHLLLVALLASLVIGGAQAATFNPKTANWKALCKSLLCHTSFQLLSVPAAGGYRLTFPSFVSVLANLVTIPIRRIFLRSLSSGVQILDIPSQSPLSHTRPR